MTRPLHLVAFTLVMLALAVAALEAGLRLSGARPLGAFTNLRYENDPDVGPWLLPSQVGFFQTPCSLSSAIHVNSFGMRDRERSLAATRPRIALVGDSFTQGVHVADEDTVSRRLESLLGNRAEVLNFGVSSTGTSVQLLSYRARVRPFRPEIVLVLFYVGNDVSDNLSALKRRLDPVMGEISPYLVLDSTGALAATPVRGRPRQTSRLVTFASSSAIGQWVYRAYQTFRLRSVAVDAPIAPGEGSDDDLVEEAWRLTERVLMRFAEEVRADGARFGLVVIPDEDPLASRAAADRLITIGERTPFPVLDLTRHLGRHALGAADPFTFDCDGHWNALGHATAANALLMFLNEQRWLGPS